VAGKFLQLNLMRI